MSTVKVEGWRWRSRIAPKYEGPGAVHGVAPDPLLTPEHRQALRRRLAAQQAERERRAVQVNAQPELFGRPT